MTSKRKTFTKAFKQEAVRLLEQGTKPPVELARELGINRRSRGQVLQRRSRGQAKVTGSRRSRGHKKVTGSGLAVTHSKMLHCKT